MKAIIICLLFISVRGFAGDIPKNLIMDLITGNDETATAAAKKLTDHPFDDLYTAITTFDGFIAPSVMGDVIAAEHKISAEMDAPYFVYVPSTYQPNEKTPLVIYLHGGVNRPEFPDRSEEEWGDDDLVKLSEANGWLLALPSARNDCLWWDLTGMDHITWLIRELKRQYNIDDDRVVMGGFSDGGSGSFHLAMLQPTDIAHFYPWSGMIAVGTLVGGIPVYPLNLTNRNLYVTNGGKDGLYPAAKMQPIMQLVIENGANLYFTSYDTSGHNWGYMPNELELMPDRVTNDAREPLRPHIRWEASDLQFGKVDWLEITEFDTSIMAARWHDEINYKMVEDRVSVGFYRNLEYEKEGMLVDSLTPDTAAAASRMGMLPGDIVLKLDDIKIKSLDDYTRWRSGKKRGEELKVVVDRGGKKVKLRAMLSPPTEYDAFPHAVKSGAIDVMRVGNHFEVKTSRVSKFSIYIHPDMVRLDQPITISVNGDDKHSAILEPDIEFMLDSYIQNRDRHLLWVGKIEISLD